MQKLIVFLISVTSACSAYAACSGEQIEKMINKGFSKSEITELCGKTILEPSTEDKNSVSASENNNSLPNIDWGPLNKYFSISNYKLGKDETVPYGYGMTDGQYGYNMMDSLLMSSMLGPGRKAEEKEEGIAFDVKCKRAPVQEMGGYSGYGIPAPQLSIMFTAIFYDHEGIKMGQSAISLSPKYTQTGWERGMPGKGYIPLTVNPAEIKFIKVQDN
jgi:hypothetical protein